MSWALTFILPHFSLAYLWNSRFFAPQETPKIRIYVRALIGLAVIDACRFFKF